VCGDRGAAAAAALAQHVRKGSDLDRDCLAARRLEQAEQAGAREQLTVTVDELGVNLEQCGQLRGQRRVLVDLAAAQAARELVCLARVELGHELVPHERAVRVR